MQSEKTREELWVLAEPGGLQALCDIIGPHKYPFILAILLTIGDTLICSVTVSAEIREPLSRRLECRSKVQRGEEDSGWGHLSLSLPRFCGTIWD